MSTHATALTGHTFEATETNNKRGFWSRFFSGLVAAREREARLRVSYHLRSMSDVQLRQIGFDDSEVRSLRTTGILPEYMGN